MEVCWSMATAKPLWDPHETNDLYFCLDAETMEPNFRAQYRDSSMGFEEASMLGHAEGDQVVPSFKRLSVYEQHHHIPPHRSSQRAPKPLPPLPDPSDLSSDEAVDSEVEFFTTSMEDDRQRLMPEHRSSSSSSKAALSFRYGVPGRRSFRGCGQINYAYFEGGATAKGSCLNAQGQEKLYGHGHGHGLAHGLAHGHGHSHGHGHKREQREPPTLVPRECASRQPDRPQRRLRRTHSGPAGSFKTAGLRLFGHGTSSSAAAAAANNNTNSSSNNNSGVTQQDKPEVPPRVPIPPLPAKSTELRQRWSMMVPSPPPHDDDDDDGGDKPPEIPPREPIPQYHVPRPYSPKSLPIYVNGVMPPTQSFAPNPKYVSKAPQHRTALHEPHCTSPTGAGAGPGPGAGHNPCILPIMEDGKKASATHYFLLPHRPAYLDRYARFFRERDCETDEGACS